jgi:hypothetical protein
MNEHRGTHPLLTSSIRLSVGVELVCVAHHPLRNVRENHTVGRQVSVCLQGNGLQSVGGTGRQRGASRGRCSPQAYRLNHNRTNTAGSQ